MEREPFFDPFGDLSLEDLLEIRVISVNKREQRVQDSAAAAYVIGHDELRRSGVTSIADALRLVPGMNVGSVSSHQWAVSSRGFNNLYANKLLVMVDGRAVYSQLFSGVFWDLQMPMFSDLDRIEVIRGPGATIWGANAVNGVINVVSKSAKDTQGGLVYGGGGDVQRAMAGVRFGGQAGDKTWYRIFSTYHEKSAYKLEDGSDAGDAWRGATTGFRVDHYGSAESHLVLQGDVTYNELFEFSKEAYNYNTLGRWNVELSERSSFEVQAYYDRTHRNDNAWSTHTLDTWDISAHHTFGLWESHDIIWGAGYRLTSSKIRNPGVGSTIFIPHHQHQLFSAFVQDEVQLIKDRLTFTTGLKIENNEFTGNEIQPSARLVYKPNARQTIWAALSRAVRTPSSLEGKNMIQVPVGAPFQGPDGGVYLPVLLGNDALQSETLLAYEAGYRFQPTSRLQVDLAVFYNEYSDVIAFQNDNPLVPGFPIGTAPISRSNSAEGHTYGAEVQVTASISSSWNLSTGWSYFRASFNEKEGLILQELFEKGSPRHQIVVRSNHHLYQRTHLDLQLRYNSSIAGASSYITADIRLEYRINDWMNVSIAGQNLLQGQHREQSELPGAITSEVPRGFYAKINVRF